MKKDELIKRYEKNLETIEETYPIIDKSMKESAFSDYNEIDIEREKQRFETSKILYTRFIKEIKNLELD